LPLKEKKKKNKSSNNFNCNWSNQKFMPWLVFEKRMSRMLYEENTD